MGGGLMQLVLGGASGASGTGTSILPVTDGVDKCALKTNIGKKEQVGRTSGRGDIQSKDTQKGSRPERGEYNTLNDKNEVEKKKKLMAGRSGTTAAADTTGSSDVRGGSIGRWWSGLSASRHMPAAAGNFALNNGSKEALHLDKTGEQTRLGKSKHSHDEAADPASKTIPVGDKFPKSIHDEDKKAMKAYSKSKGEDATAKDIKSKADESPLSKDTPKPAGDGIKSKVGSPRTQYEVGVSLRTYVRADAANKLSTPITDSGSEDEQGKFANQATGKPNDDIQAVAHGLLKKQHGKKKHETNGAGPTTGTIRLADVSMLKTHGKRKKTHEVDGPGKDKKGLVKPLDHDGPGKTQAEGKSASGDESTVAGFDSKAETGVYPVVQTGSEDKNHAALIPKSTTEENLSLDQMAALQRIWKKEQAKDKSVKTIFASFDQFVEWFGKEIGGIKKAFQNGDTDLNKLVVTDIIELDKAVFVNTTMGIAIKAKDTWMLALAGTTQQYQPAQRVTVKGGKLIAVFKDSTYELSPSGYSLLPTL